MVGEESREVKDQSEGSQPGNSRDVEAGKESLDKKAGIFVRLSPKSKDVLETAAIGRTYGQVIERLLEYLNVQESDLQKKILDGIHVNPLKESEDLLAQLNRAQHAYEEKRYYYAVKTYSALTDKLDGVDSSKELLEFCNYRLGHSWISLAYELRREALSDRSHTDAEGMGSAEIYSIAQRALDAALDALQRVTDDQDNLTNLIAHYNVACCYSLKAQYTVESKIDADKPAGRRLRNQSLDVQEAWDDIGQDWRKQYGKDDLPEEWAEDAMVELSNVYSGAQVVAASGSTGGDTIWIVEMARRDADFIFLRSDKEVWKEKFDDWSKDALPNDNPIARAATQLLRDLRRH